MQDTDILDIFNGFLTEEMNDLFYGIVTCENNLERRKLLVKYSEHLIKYTEKETNTNKYLGYPHWKKRAD